MLILFVWQFLKTYLPLNIIVNKVNQITLVQIPVNTSPDLPEKRIKYEAGFFERYVARVFLAGGPGATTFFCPFFLNKGFVHKIKKLTNESRRNTILRTLNGNTAMNV